MHCFKTTLYSYFLQYDWCLPIVFDYVYYICYRMVSGFKRSKVSKLSHLIMFRRRGYYRLLVKNNIYTRVRVYCNVLLINCCWINTTLENCDEIDCIVWEIDGSMIFMRGSVNNTISYITWGRMLTRYRCPGIHHRSWSKSDWPFEWEIEMKPNTQTNSLSSQMHIPSPLLHRARQVWVY